MSTATSSTAKRVACPSCGSTGKQVQQTTLRTLLKDEFASGFTAAGHSCCGAKETGATPCVPPPEETTWRFCGTPGCATVYFSEQGNNTFTTSQLKVPVGVKETTGQRPLCYCFTHSVASIKEELRTQGRSAALEDIRAKMKDPGCRCETENPSGSCCLGSVAKGIEIARQELGMGGTDVPTPPSRAQSSTGKGEKIAKIGTVASAVMASSCCWLPLVLVVAGVSGAGIAATLEAYRPLFTVITFGFLGTAFYFTYRPKKALDAGGHGCCATQSSDATDCCAAAKGRFGALALNKVMLWVVAVMAVGFLFFPSYVGVLLGETGGTAVSDDMNRAVIHVEGMTCAGCSAVVATAVRAVPGVLAVDVDFAKREAVVGSETGRPVPSDKILAALEGVGYRGTIVDN